MSNWIDYELDVLAGSPAQMNQIAARLQKPSTALVTWVTGEFGEPSSDVADSLKELVRFEAIRNLGYVHPDANKARRFTLSSSSREFAIVNSHLYEVSTEFSSAVFLLTYRDMSASYSGKHVIRAGEITQSVRDGNQKLQSLDWILIDIFPPFLAEYYDGLPFASLWQEWLCELAAAVMKLTEQSSPTAREGAKTTKEFGRQR